MSHQHNGKNIPPRGVGHTREAIAWYLRYLLLGYLEKGDKSQKEIATIMGVEDTRLIYLKQDARGAGFEMIDAFARYEGKEPWEILRNAQLWWIGGGRSDSEEELRKILKAREERGFRAATKSKYKRTESSERPSVRAMNVAAVKKVGD